MEKTLLDLRSIEVLLGKMESMAFLGRGHGIRFPKKFSDCRGRGFLVKASHPIARTPRESFDFVAPERLTSNDSSWVNRNGGASLWTTSGESLVLDSYEDEYGGIIINPENLPRNANFFASMLRSSLSHWKLKGKKGVWLNLPLNNSDLVPIAVKEGFKYHHAEKSYLMLTYWIPEGPCMLPANASHQVGVGGFVISEKNEVLVVKERHCASFEAIWKLPTGFIHESEEIFTGAVREVKEETGIDTEFVEVIAFRHAHHVAFEKSDLFFICMLRPLSSQISIDDLEIQAAKWMPLVEFIEQPFVQGDSMFKKIIQICLARLEKHYCGLAAHEVTSTFDGRSSTLYYNVAEPRDFNCKGG